MSLGENQVFAFVVLTMLTGWRVRCDHVPIIDLTIDPSSLAGWEIGAQQGQQEFCMIVSLMAGDQQKYSAAPPSNEQTFTLWGNPVNLNTKRLPNCQGIILTPIGANLDSFKG